VPTNTTTLPKYVELRFAIEKLFPEEHLDHSSPATAFNLALRHDLITRPELEAARLYYGRAWDYCGD
jgi:hypothetical protein